jgi:hypothetical protein
MEVAGRIPLPMGIRRVFFVPLFAFDIDGAQDVITVSAGGKGHLNRGHELVALASITATRQLEFREKAVGAGCCAPSSTYSRPLTA